MNPSCPGYGFMFEACDDCDHCLLRGRCRQQMEAPRYPMNARGEVIRNPPKDKKKLVLQVCRKHGIATIYRPRGGGDEVHIDESNCGNFSTIDFLLTNKEALLTLLSTA